MKKSEMIHSYRTQLKDNLVAIISLVIAIVALTYTTWREEVTEKTAISVRLLSKY